MANELERATGNWSQTARAVAWAMIAVALVSAAYAVVSTHAPHLVMKSRMFHFYMRKASGVEVGTPVWVTGVEAGRVTYMEPALVPATLAGGTAAEGRIFAVKVTCRVFSPYHSLIRDGSSVEVLLLSLLGSPRVDVFPGQPGSPTAPDGAILSQRITRGTEGAVEQLLDAGQRMDSSRKQLVYSLDEIEKNLDEITGSYERGNNTLFSLVDKKADRGRLKEIGASLEATASEIKANFDAIKCDTACLDKEAARELETALKETADGLKKAVEYGAEAGSAIPRLIDEVEKASDTASSVSRKIRTFNDKFRLLLEAQAVFVPGILADWDCIRTMLIVRGIMNVRIMALFQPGVEEMLRFIYRGRLEASGKNQREKQRQKQDARPSGVADRDGMK